MQHDYAHCRWCFRNSCFDALYDQIDPLRRCLGSRQFRGLRRIDHISTLYHALLPSKAKKVFRVIDHCTIYLLIAGTYTPIVLVSLRTISPLWAWIVFGVVWGSALVAITLTAIDMHKFRIFSMIAYLAMGWCILICLKDCILAVGSTGMWLIFFGGVLYTIGAVIYMIGKKNNVPYVHSVFHVFVLFACILHFVAIYLYVLS